METITRTNDGILLGVEDETFSWDSTIDNTKLTYKPTGKQIYQMQWYEWGNSVDITNADLIAQVRKFWAIVREAQNPKAVVVAREPKAEARGDGWCEKCQSYCYGDCEA